MQRTHWALFLLLFATFASAQSLGDLARKEKKRRETNQQLGVTARLVTEDEVGPGPAVVSRPGSEPNGDLDVGPAAPVVPPGEPAPDFSLPDRSGRSYSLANFRGRPLLIDFWATWCGPCRKTMPEVQRLHEQYGRELQVVGINIEGNSPDVLGYLDEGGYTFPVLFDSGNWDSIVALSYGVSSIPRTFLLDRIGRVLYVGHPRGLSEEQIQAAIAAR